MIFRGCGGRCARALPSRWCPAQAVKPARCFLAACCYLCVVCLAGVFCRRLAPDCLVRILVLGGCFLPVVGYLCVGCVVVVSRGCLAPDELLIGFPGWACFLVGFACRWCPWSFVAAGFFFTFIWFGASVLYAFGPAVSVS